MPFKLIREDLDLSLIDGLVVLNNINSEKITAFENKILLQYKYIKPSRTNNTFLKKMEIINSELDIDGKIVNVVDIEYPDVSYIHLDVKARYSAILERFLELGCETVAIPFFPNSILLKEQQDLFQEIQELIINFLKEHEMMIYLILDKKHDIRISNSILSGLKRFLSKKKREQYENIEMSFNKMVSYDAVHSFEDLSNRLNQIDEGFSGTLLKLIDLTGEKDSTIYKKANIDRKLFSKIRNNKDYKPSKKTAIAFAIALELSEDETLDLIERAGYTLSDAIPFDVIIQYCLDKPIYNIFKINEILYDNDQDTF